MFRIAARTLVISLTMVSAPALAQEASGWVTTSSLIEESRYSKDFTHYSHANPDAPKGGDVKMAAQGTFDSLNPYIIKGTAAAGLAGRGFGGGLLYDTLRDQSVDEPSTSHPLVSEAIPYPEDSSFAIYRLNTAARWHDAKPITPEDVVWSFEVHKQYNQLYREDYENVTPAETKNETDNVALNAPRHLLQCVGDFGQLETAPQRTTEGSCVPCNRARVLIAKAISDERGVTSSPR